MSLSAITGNDLREGAVVFWSHGRWASHFSDAELFDARDAGERALEQAAAQLTLVVEPYLIDLVEQDGVAVPASYRERVRALGPTIHPDMGPQTEGGAAVEAMRHHAGGARSDGRLGLIRRKK